MNDALSWDDANAACLAKGLQLASVHSEAENDLLVTAAAGNQVWIGGTDAYSEGTWAWSPSNTPVSYTNWNTGQPDNDKGNEHCLQIYNDQAYNSDAIGKWNDQNCNHKQKYVCQPNKSYTFTTKASLQTAVQAYNTDPTAAIATNGPIADWDVSAITDMSRLFYNLQNVNADISNWDTSKVTTMKQMFLVRSARALATKP